MPRKNTQEQRNAYRMYHWLALYRPGDEVHLREIQHALDLDASQASRAKVVMMENFPDSDNLVARGCVMVKIAWPPTVSSAATQIAKKAAKKQLPVKASTPLLSADEAEVVDWFTSDSHLLHKVVIDEGIHLVVSKVACKNCEHEFKIGDKVIVSYLAGKAQARFCVSETSGGCKAEEHIRKQGRLIKDKTRSNA